MSSNEFAPVVALPADLMFASRIRAAAQAAGASVDLVTRPAALLARVQSMPPRRILVDLDARGWDPVAVITTLREDSTLADTEIVAWVSHVREDAIEAARDAGADRVLARSGFSRQLHQWVQVEQV